MQRNDNLFQVETMKSGKSIFINCERTDASKKVNGEYGNKLYQR